MMNTVLAIPNLNRYLIYSVMKTPEGFLIRRRVIGNDGKLLGVFDLDTHTSEAAAKDAMKLMVDLKVLHYRLRRVYRPPAHVRACLLSDTTVSDSEKAKMMEAARHERYVVFRDVTGLEELFDPGLEYLAYDRGYPDTLEVLDKFGEPCACCKNRFASVRPTEAAEELADSMKGHTHVRA